jgi:hypothetical protein
VYVAPSGVHGTEVVFVFATWNETGTEATFTAAPAEAAMSAAAASEAAHTAPMIASRETVVR